MSVTGQLRGLLFIGLCVIPCPLVLQPSRGHVVDDAHDVPCLQIWMASSCWSTLAWSSTFLSSVRGPPILLQGRGCIAWVLRL